MLVSFIGCQSATDVRLPATNGPVPWTNKNFRNDSRNFQFAVVSDRCGGHRPGVFGQAVGKLNIMQPEFVICVGDLIEGYTEDTKVLESQWNEFDSMVDKLDMPFFYVTGNHDAPNPTMSKMWEERYGLRYYHFVYQDVLFLSVCSVDGRLGYISDEQVANIKKALEENQNARWTFLFLHLPMWETNMPAYIPISAEQWKQNNWAKVEDLLKGRNYTVFAGHDHVYSTIRRNGMDYIKLATTGGVSNLQPPAAMDHFMWVTMTDSGPQIANVLLDGVLDMDIPAVK